MHSSTISINLFKLYFVVVSIALTFISFFLIFFLSVLLFSYMNFHIYMAYFYFCNSSFPSIEVHIGTLFSMKNQSFHLLTKLNSKQRYNQFVFLLPS